MTPPFEYIEAQSLDDAVALLSRPGSVAMGGGTDLLAQVRDGVVAAQRLVGLAAIPGMDAIAETDGGAHPVVRRRYAALAEAAGAGRVAHSHRAARGCAGAQRLPEGT